MAKDRSPNATLDQVIEDDEASISHSLSYEQLLHEAGVKRRGSGLFRIWRRPTGAEIDPDGSVYLLYTPQERPVAMSLAEARKEGLDYLHPDQGWIRYGLKREQEAEENIGTGSTSMHSVERVRISGPTQQPPQEAD